MNDLLTLLGGHQNTVPITGGGFGNLGSGFGNLQGLLGMLLSRGKQQPPPILMGANQVPIQRNQDTYGYLDTMGNYHSGAPGGGF